MSLELGLNVPADEADPGGAAAADAIKRRLDGAVEVARERMLVQEPAYRRMTQEDLADVTALLYRNYGVLLAAMAGARINHQTLDYVGEHVRARVRSGIPLEAVLEAYRIGLNVFWEECTAEVAAGGMSRDAAVNLARKMSEAMDILTTHAAAAYVREESYLKAAREKGARDLLEALLRGDADPSRFELHNIAPGLDPQADLVVIIGRLATEESLLAPSLDTAATALGESLATRRVSPLLVVREQAVVAVVLAEATDLLTERLTSVRAALAEEQGIDLYCGVSSPCSGFGGVAAAHEQASLAVSRASAERPVISLAVLPAIQHLLTGATLTTRLHLLEKARTIRSLQATERQTMRETLQGFAGANMNVTRGAAELHIHENTLRYRLRRLRERTGHDPQTFAGLLELLCLMEVVDAAELEGEQLPAEVGAARPESGG